MSDAVETSLLSTKTSTSNESGIGSENVKVSVDVSSIEAISCRSRRRFRCGSMVRGFEVGAERCETSTSALPSVPETSLAETRVPAPFAPTHLWLCISSSTSSSLSAGALKQNSRQSRCGALVRFGTFRTGTAASELCSQSLRHCSKACGPRSGLQDVCSGSPMGRSLQRPPALGRSPEKATWQASTTPTAMTVSVVFSESVSVPGRV